MKKEKFSFVKWLTNRDVEKILNSMGIEILKNEYNREGKKLKPITKHKDKETGLYRALVRCQLNEDLLNENNKQMSDFFLPKKLKQELVKTLFPKMAVVMAMPFFSESMRYYDGSLMMLEINDFYISEFLSLKPEEEQIKFGRALTKGYQHYMTKKFGRFYNSMKSAAIKKAIAEDKANEEKEELCEKN